VIVMVVVMVMAMVAVPIPSLLLIFVRRIRTVGDSRRSFLQKSKPSSAKTTTFHQNQIQPTRRGGSSSRRTTEQMCVCLSLCLLANRLLLLFMVFVLVPRTKPLGNP
jgi:Tfp pilus assembly protein FimT